MNFIDLLLYPKLILTESQLKWDFNYSLLHVVKYGMAACMPKYTV